MIKTFGEVDARSLAQLERCMAAGDAQHRVLCADHHPDYSQPIGGGIAYDGHVSPSGVGYDTGCISRGARVTTDAYALPIERVAASAPVSCLDGGRLRLVEPHAGAVARGLGPVVRKTLSNGRMLRLATEVYKRLPDVLAAHGDTIRVKHTLRPLGVAMAGRDVVDPYKD